MVPTPPSPVIWEAGDAPRSRVFGDVYFSRDDGLAETRAVFLAGCGLPGAWTDRQRFTVGELGFGTGLNIAALLDLWARTRPSGAHLHVFTIEADPLTAAEAARALGAWPELAEVAAAMTARWPGRARGFHRMDLPAWAASVDVAIMEAGEALEAWDGAADAWFLDGFAPALNPDLWRAAVLDLVARRSVPGARAATYTVAGAVRRTLASAGCAVERRPGHGRKRERLEARMPGIAPTGPPPPRIAIIGGGIAGASLARAFAALGVEARAFEAERPGAGASGGPAALSAPRLDAGLGPAAALFAQAARRAAALYERVPGAVLGRGVLQAPTGPKDPGRFAAIAASDLFEPEAMRCLTREQAAARLGEAPAGGGAPDDLGGLLMADAVTVNPSVVLAAWLGDVQTARVAGLERAGDHWRLLDARGEAIGEADGVCLAAGMGCVGLAPALVMTPVRGQATWTRDAAWTQAAMFGAYALPLGDGVLAGATHDRDDTGRDLRPEDRTRTLEALSASLPGLAGRLAGARLNDWAAVRASTRDYLPLAGAVPDAEGLFLLTGLGSRGFCLAPLLAEHLTAQVLARPSPLPRALAALVDPRRFARRAARTGRPPRDHGQASLNRPF
jgi:tRNA 5-methylaminomethyl-2-thiouridine biosynthesis bifunctional protein